MRLCAALALSLIVPGTALANDSIAELGTGGLILSRTDAVVMRSEDLFISSDEIRVNYVFHNQSDKDVQAIVAFPMPDIDGNPYELPALPPDAGDNFLGFQVSVDGRPVKPTLEQHAIATGLDVSADLQRHGVPLYPFGDAAFAALAALPQPVADDWISRGMLMIDTYDDGSGWKDVRTPVWTLRSAYWWQSNFPAGRDVAVSHHYRPSVGNSVGVGFFYDGRFHGELDDYQRRFCMDDAFKRAVEQSAKASPDGTPQFSETRIRYVLSSGGNWALGNIGKFHLTVDKGDQYNLVSFCADGVKKTGPHTFEVTAKDFVPERDLDILILLPVEHDRGAATAPERKRKPHPAQVGNP